jgi:hypothetical protein
VLSYMNVVGLDRVVGGSIGAIVRDPGDPPAVVAIQPAMMCSLLRPVPPQNAHRPARPWVIVHRA